MDDRRVAGRATGSLLLALLLLLGAGGWNYHRNYRLELESLRDRPYASYAQRDVELLRDAVAGELETARARLVRAKQARPRAVRDRGSVADNVRQFDRTARASSSLRDAAATVAEHERTKAVLDHELAQRADGASGWAVHVRRLTTL